MSVFLKSQLSNTRKTVIINKAYDLYKRFEIIINEFTNLEKYLKSPILEEFPRFISCAVPLTYSCFF